MTRKTQSIGLAIVICTLPLAGCGLSSRDRKTQIPDDVKTTPAEQEKAKVLKQIDRNFQNPKAHFELGQLYQDDGLWTHAANEYRIALNFDPAYKPAQAARVKVLMQLGDNTKAELLADEYMSQASTSAAGSLNLALAFQKQQLDDYAHACYQRALRLAPTSAKINRQIAYYYLSKNDTARGKDYLMRSFDLNWNQPEVAGELGRLGVLVSIPQKTQKHTKKLDKIVEQSDKEMIP